MQHPEKYGSKYFAIHEHDEVTWVYADEIRITPEGDLFALGGFRTDPEKAPEILSVIHGVSRHHWTHFYAASAMDGSPVASPDFE